MFSLAKKLSLTVRSVMASAIDNLFTALKGRATYSENIADSKQVVKDIDNYELLDKASILLTPTAYSDARVHSVKTYTGDELVSGGTFETQADVDLWTGYYNAVLTLNNNRLLITPSTSNSSRATRAITTVVGATYKLVVDFENPDTSTVLIGFSNNANGSGATYVTSTDASGTLTLYYKATATTTYTSLSRLTNDAKPIYYDNVSIVDVSSDFDFDRASSATRINSDGLVQDMQSITDPELVLNGDFEELGDEEVTNGTFDTDSDWIKAPSGVTISGGLANFNSASDTYVYQDILTATKTYKVIFSGTINSGSFYIGENGVATNTYTAGTYTNEVAYFTVSSSARFIIRRTGLGTLDATIDNVSVQQVDPNDRWTLGTGWSVEDGKLVGDGNMTASDTVNQAYNFTDGNTYKFSFEITERTQGSVFIREPFDGGSDAVGTVGTHTFNYVAGAANELRLRSDDNFTGKIDNISIKDITFSEDVDLARINYDSNGENGHWLLEPTSTNLVTYSEDFSEWSNVYAILTANQPSPDGFNNAFIIEDEDATAYRKIDETITTTATPHTFSVFIKKKTSAVSSYSGIQMGSGFSYVIFDSYNGTYNQYSNTNYDSVEVEDFNSDWWRLKLTVSVTTSTRVALWGAISTNGTSISASATGSETFYGGQLEELSYATSYIPTYGSTVTRATETLTGSGNSTLINSTEGVLYAEIAALADDSTNRLISLSNADTSQQVWLYFNTSNGLTYRVYNGSTQSTYSHSINTKTFNKIAVKYKANDFGLFVNGIKVYTDTSGSTFTENTLTKLNFDAGDGALDFYGEVKALAVFDEALTDDELELLTGITNYGSFNELAQANGYTII